MRIIWFNVVNDNYRIYELDDIQPQIKQMFEEFKKASLFEGR